MLGAVYLVCSMLVFGGTALADPEGKLRAVLAGRAPEGELPPADLLLPIAVFALSYAPVLLMFWFAPPLAAWHSTGALKALVRPRFEVTGFGTLYRAPALGADAIIRGVLLFW